MLVWSELEKVGQLDLERGLMRVSGLKAVYEKSLRLMLDEIPVCCEKLCEYADNGDIESFRVTVHGAKSSLANIGAEGLSAQALELENAARRQDTAFIGSALGGFMDGIRELERDLRSIFENGGTEESGEIGPEAVEALRKLKSFLEDMDFMAIDEAVNELEAFSFDGAVASKLAAVKDLILTMDYDEAAEMIGEWV